MNGLSHIDGDKARTIVSIFTFFKKTMMTKLNDLQRVTIQHNSYGGLGKNFNYKNLNHYARWSLGMASVYAGLKLKNPAEEIYYGYDPSGDEPELSQILNEWGMYTMLDGSGISRSLGKTVSGGVKTVEGVGELGIGKFTVRNTKRIMNLDKKRRKVQEKKAKKL